MTSSVLTSPKSLGPTHSVRNLASPVLFLEDLDSIVFGSIVPDVTKYPQKSASVDLIHEIKACSTLECMIKRISKGRADLLSTFCTKRNKNAVEIICRNIYQLLSVQITLPQSAGRPFDSNTMQDLAYDILISGCPVSIAAVNFPHNLHAKHNHIHDLPAGVELQLPILERTTKVL